MESIHLQGGLEVPEPQLDAPTPRVEAGQLGSGIGLGIGQGRHQGNRLGAETGHGELEAQDPDREFLGHPLPKGVGQIAGFDLRLAPGEEPVVLTQASTSPQIGGPALVEAKETLDLASQEQGDQDIAAEASVTDGQVVGFEEVQELTRQGQFMLVLVAFDVIQERASG